MSGIVKIQQCLLLIKDAEGKEWTLVADVLDVAAPKGQTPTVENTVCLAELRGPMTVTEVKMITR